MRIAVLVSGNGSNLQALIDACADGRIAGEIVLVLSNRAGVHALERAAKAGIPSTVMTLARGADRTAYDVALAEAIATAKPDLVVLAGFMHILSSAFIERIGTRCINLHPAFPGAFPGTDAIGRAFDAARAGGPAETGVMVHEVIEEVDAGRVLGVRRVPILPTDDLPTLETRMHTAEHELLVEVVNEISVGCALAHR